MLHEILTVLGDVGKDGGDKFVDQCEWRANSRRIPLTKNGAREARPVKTTRMRQTVWRVILTMGCIIGDLSLRGFGQGKRTRYDKLFLLVLERSPRRLSAKPEDH